MNAELQLDTQMVDRFVRDMSDGKINFTKKEVGSGGDVRVWGVDQSNEVVKELVSLFIKYTKLPKDSAKNITAMYNIIPVGDGINSGDGWHFDSALSQCKCFCYLSDVNSKEYGAINFLRFSGKARQVIYRLLVVVAYGVSRSNRISKKFLKILRLIGGKEEVITGERGFVFIEDTSFPHKGGEQVVQPRHAITLYYFEKDPEWLSSNLRVEN